MRKLLAVLLLLAAQAAAQTYDAEGRLLVNGKPWVLGQSTMSASMPVVLPSNQSAIPVTQSGTWNVGTLTSITNSVTVTDGAGALNVIVDSGSITANAGTNLNTSALLTTTDYNNSFGTAGSADTQVQTVQGIAGMTPVQVSDGAGALNTILDSGTLTSITNSVTITDGAGALNVIVDSITAGDNNIGNVDVVTMPSVTIGTFPDNEPINVAQMNGVAVTMGNGASGTGVQRVTIASDSTGQVAVSSFPDNEPINLGQVGGTATPTNTGDVAAGVLRVREAGSPNLTVGQVSCGNTATALVSARAGRLGVSVTNLGTVDVYVGPSSGVTTANGDLLLGVKGGTASYDTSSALYCIVTSGSQSVSYAEVY